MGLETVQNGTLVSLFVCLFLVSLVFVCLFVRFFCLFDSRHLVFLKGALPQNIIIMK